MNEATPEPRCCEICGRPINRNNQLGICGRPDSPECVRKRSQRKREGFTADTARPVFTAGEVFGNWITLETCVAQRQLVRCRCACGREKRVRAEKLVSGRSRSCGCNAVASMVEARFSVPYIPAGAVFVRLTVLEDVPRSDGRASCRCACGREKEVNAIGLKGGSIKSCGCLSQERRSKLNGFSKHPLYPTWNGIIDRCTDPKNPSYHNYGGRPDQVIEVCDRWRDPWVFAEDIYREIGPRPEARYKNGRAMYELDRIDNDRGYEPGNVRWADKRTQRLNQRSVSGMTKSNAVLAARVAELEALLAICTCRKAALP